MDKQMHEVMQRRQVLLSRISAQREELAEISVRWTVPLRFADQTLLAVRFLRSHPVLLAGVASLAVVRRRGVIGFAKITWRIWKSYRNAGNFVKNVTSRL